MRTDIAESSSSNVEDIALVHRVAAGDMQAVGTLYDRHAPRLLGCALRIVGARAEAEDIIHDAFVLVAERAWRYEAARGAVAAWLITLVRNLAIDRTRRLTRRGAIERELLAYEPMTPAAAPERALIDAGDRACVRLVLARLSEPHREVIEAAFFEGLSYSELARRHRVPVGTIKSRAHRAFASYRAYMREARA